MSWAQTSDGTRICYRAEGSGTPLLLCNASFSTLAHWAPEQAALSRQCRVVTWDYRGHGRSDAPEDDTRYSLERVVADLRAVHEAAIGEEPAFVGGLSVGGLVALGYALAWPERTRGLLLFNTGPGFKNADALQAWQGMLERAAQKMERLGLEKYLEGPRAQAELLGRDPQGPRAAELRRGILGSSVAGLTRFARHVAGPVPNLVDRLGEVRAPCLVLVGEHDAAFQRASEVLAAKLPRARREVLAGAGHVLNVDQSAAFVRAVECFLREADGL